MGFTTIAAIRIKFDSPWCNEKNTQLLRKRHTRRRKTDRQTDTQADSQKQQNITKAHGKGERE